MKFDRFAFYIQVGNRRFRPILIGRVFFIKRLVVFEISFGHSGIFRIFLITQYNLFGSKKRRRSSLE